jgi:hypothetical protein
LATRRSEENFIRGMMKPTITKTYPSMEIKGKLYPKSTDRLFLIFKENHIEISAHVDGTGNEFILPLDVLRKMYHNPK